MSKTNKASETPDSVSVQVEGVIYRATASWGDWAKVAPTELINRALRQWLSNQERILGNDDYADEWLDEPDTAPASPQEGEA